MINNKVYTYMHSLLHIKKSGMCAIGKCTLIALFSTGLCFAAKKDDEAAQINAAKNELLQKIETLKTTHRTYQEQYRLISEQRWKQQKQQVTRKEENKESAETVRQKLELLYAEIARSKEESLLKQQTLEEENGRFKERNDVWQYLDGQVDDKIEKTATLNRAGFPLDMENTSQKINAINLSGKRSSSEKKLNEIFTLRLNRLKQSMTCGITKRTIIGPEGEAFETMVLRLGHVSAWALNTEMRAFMLTSLEQATSFDWSEITDPQILTTLNENFPVWMQEKKLNNMIPVDILQNEKTRDLVGREEVGLLATVKKFAFAGGPILIPLGLIVLWALILIFNRWLVYFVFHSRNKKVLNRVVLLLNENKRDEVKKLLGRRSGLAVGLSRIFLTNKITTRDQAERAVEEYFLKEGPKLDKYLDTISVLAGASPLLGLLGTVTGMIRLFEVITRVGTGDPKMMAGGISEALITTEVGLAIAIPLVLLHNWLRSRRNTLISDTEMYAVQILNRLYPQSHIEHAHHMQHDRTASGAFIVEKSKEAVMTKENHD